MKNEKKLKEYETVWTCDYCGEEFKTKKESDKHELKCKKNPINKNKTIEIVISVLVIFFFVYLFTYFIVDSYAQLNGFKGKTLNNPSTWFINEKLEEVKQENPKTELQNVKYNGKVISGIVFNKSDKPIFNSKVVLKISKDRTAWNIDETHEFVVPYKIDPNQSINFSENYKTTKKDPWWTTLIQESHFYNGENIPTPSPTAIPTKKPVQILNNDNILRLINQYRQQNGLEMLTKSEELCRLAEQRASYLMADRMSAYRSSDVGNHAGFSSSADGYSGNGIGENIGANIPPGFKDNPYGDYSGYTKQYTTNQDVGAVSQWVHSPPHNALLLVNEKDGVKVTKGCVAHRIEDYAMLTVLLVGDK